MKKISLAIIFILIAVGLVWAGIWYDNKLSAEDTQSAAAQSAAAAAAEAQLLSEITIKDTTVGTGAVAEDGDTLTVNYVGTLDNGTTFDSSYSRNQPFTFTLGVGNVIPGWDLGLVGMKVGGTRTLVIPPDLAYGSEGNGPVPGNATLHFTIQLLSIATSTATTSTTANSSSTQ
jgi:FKBP-type peptidyl-prolyl cis-trans isomerase